MLKSWITTLAPRAVYFIRGVTLIVQPAQEGLAIEADQQILAAVVGNLLQNAFKFTRPNSTVTLTVGASADRVLIEVQDECGGLPGAKDGKELFPSSSNRALIEPAWALGSRLVDGARKRTAAGCMRATFLIGAASLPWTCRGPQFPLSRSCRLNPHAEPLRDVARGYRADRSDPIVNANGRSLRVTLRRDSSGLIPAASQVCYRDPE